LLTGEGAQYLQLVPVVPLIDHFSLPSELGRNPA
jgi:hypothetical protein